MSYWLTNFLKILLFTTIALTAHFYIQKIIARKYGCTAIVNLWKINRLSLRKQLKLKIPLTKFSISSIPLGIILSIIIYILSGGQIFFAAITALSVNIKKSYRIGKKFTNLTNFESAKIAVVGPLTNILLALLASAINIPFLTPFVTINLAIAISYMLPLPGIDGGTIFFGSKPLYLTSLIFMGIIALIMNYMTTISTIIIATVFASLALVTYLHYESK